MRICHVTPHLPPDQAANALLPFHLGRWAVDSGDCPSYVAHPPQRSGSSEIPGPVTWIPRQDGHGQRKGFRKLSAAMRAAGIFRRVSPLVAAADLVHIHSSGLLTEVAALAARRHGKPVVLTLYGTEIWHYRARRPVDLFRSAYRLADHVTFYSEGLRARARALGLNHPAMSVIYPPVAQEFVWCDGEQQMRARSALGLRAKHILLNVKRLHPLAGQRFAIEALGKVVRRHPDTQMVICGTGSLLDDLKQEARRAGVEPQVRFDGLIANDHLAAYYAAADAFILPSLLEACPTVALEALASGTPVISSDNPGGVELHELFGDDVVVVPREDPSRLAVAIGDFLEHRFRTRPTTRERIERELRPAVVAGRYREIYASAASNPVPRP